MEWHFSTFVKLPLQGVTCELIHVFVHYDYFEISSNLNSIRSQFDYCNIFTSLALRCGAPQMRRSANSLTSGHAPTRIKLRVWVSNIRLSLSWSESSCRKFSWVQVRVSSAQENFGEPKRVQRARYYCGVAVSLSEFRFFFVFVADLCPIGFGYLKCNAIIASVLFFQFRFVFTGGLSILNLGMCNMQV